MALTSSVKTDLYRFFAVAFDAAPGVTYMSQLTNAVNAGMTIPQIVEVFTTKPQFTSVYPVFFTNEQFAAKLIQNVVGDSATTAAKAEAAANIVSALALGGEWTRGKVIYTIFNNLANKPVTDATWGNTAKQMANQVAYAEYYTEVLLGDSTDMGILSSVIANVTPASSTAAADVASAMSSFTGQTFTLTADAPSVTETDNASRVLTFTLKIDKAPVNDLVINYAVDSNGTATLGDDFTGTAGAVTFAAGQTTASVQVTVLADNVKELNETIVLKFTNNEVVSSTIGSVKRVNDLTATGTIIDDDADVDTVYNLTEGVDAGAAFKAGDANDTFNATGVSLQTGDHLDGGNGEDILVVSIDDRHPQSGSNHYSAPTLSNIETIRVNAPNVDSPHIYIDLSNTTGVKTIESFQVSDYYEDTDGKVEFLDIQDVSNTNIKIVDTNVDHEFTYDNGNAYKAGALNDIVHLTVQEVTGSTLTFSNDRPYEAGESNVEKVNLTSAARNQISNTTANTIEALQVGSDFKELVIDGNADLEVTAALDRNIGKINATALTADLTLTVDHTEADTITTSETFQYDGAQGDDTFTLTRNGNSVTNLGEGNDHFDATGNGQLTVTSGAGNDHVDITGNGSHNIDLGAGNDQLDIVGNAIVVTVVNAGTGNDAVSVTGDGKYNVDLGDGNDSFGKVGDGNNNITAGAGVDSITVSGDGNQTVNAGSGNDSVVITGDGDNVIVSAEGDDNVAITGTGMQNVNLGEGNDTLTITGSASGNVDYAGAELASTIMAGDGNDVVDVKLDHILYADLGAGDDTLTLRAQDLTTDDKVQGGAGIDTLVLTNAPGLNYESQAYEIGRSETNHTTGFEIFDLRDSNLTLSVTDQMVASAEGGNITVSTENSAPDPEIQLVGRVKPLYIESMTQTVDLTGLSKNLPNSFKLIGGSIRDIIIANDELINGDMELRFDHSGETVEGVNSGDTLRVVDGATLSAADLKNVTGLERIELLATGNSAQKWTIQLNENVINQTTDNDDLVITVAADVPAGSKLYIDLRDKSIVNADSNVIIERNSNVQVYVDTGDGEGYQIVSEPSYQLNPNYSLSVLTEQVFTTNSDNLHGSTFTANSINEVQSSDIATGEGCNNTVHFNFAVSNPNAELGWQLNGASFIDIDSIEFNTENNVNFDGMDLNGNTSPFGEDSVGTLRYLSTGSGDDSLQNVQAYVSYKLNDGDDFISFSGNNYGPTPNIPQYIYVDGGIGQDTLALDNYQTAYVQNVEFIDAFGGPDSVGTTVTMLSNESQSTVTATIEGDTVPVGLVTMYGVDSINGSQFGDYVDATYWGYDTAVAINMGAGNDTIDISKDANETITVSTTSDTINGQSGDDKITYHRDGATVTVYGDDSLDAVGGNDEIHATATNATVFGYLGADTIVVDAVSGSISGGDGADSIDFTGLTTVSAFNISGGAGDDTIVVDSDGSVTVSGDTGADVITVSTDNNASVDGGSGNDDIHVTYGFTTVTASDTANVTGGEGDDTITIIEGTGSNGATITGGAGNDLIHLDSVVSGHGDILIFGNLSYTAAQAVTVDSQGIDTIDGFVFEDSIAPGGDPTPNAQDKIDLSAFLGDKIDVYGTYGIGDSVFNAPDTVSGAWDNGDEINVFGTVTGSGLDALVVLSFASESTTLTSKDFSNSVPGTIQLNDNSRAVIVAGINGTGVNSGIDTFEIYFVQDVDSGVGQTWHVDKVAVIESVTLVGIESVIDNFLPVKVPT